MATLTSIDGGKGRTHAVNQSGLSAPTPEQYEQFMVWRSLALEEMPYFSSLLFSLRVVNVPNFNTYAVDAYHRLYIGFDEVVKRGSRWNVESLLHECLHLLSAHADMATDLHVLPHERGQWNFAADASINDDLVDAGCMSFATGEDPMPAQLGAPNGKPGAFYFQIIRKMVREQQKRDEKDRGQKSDSTDPNGTGEGQGAGGFDPNDFKGCGSGSGGESAPFELDEKDDLGGTADALDEVERERVRIQTAHEIKEHKSRGNVPGGLVEMAETIIEPSPLPWQNLIGGLFRRQVAFRRGQRDHSRTKVNRRRHDVRVGGGRAMYPGQVEPVVKVEIIRDTSGSMSAREFAFVSREVEAIARRCGIRGKDLVVTDVDAKVQRSVDYKGAASIAHVKGRGGTDMTKGITAAEQRPKNERPDFIVVLTDGATPWPKEPPSIKVIAAVCALNDPGRESVPEFIEYVHVPVDNETETTPVAV